MQWVRVRAMSLTLAWLMLICGQTVMAQTNPAAKAAELESEGHFAQAEMLWRAWSNQHPGDAVAYAHLGELAERQNNFADAIAEYRKAMAIAPSMPGLRPNLGLVYFRNG